MAAHCPTCDGPTYCGAAARRARWCPKCGPRAPSRPPTADEVVLVLVDPYGREREVYRRAGDQVYTASGEPLWVGQRDVRKRAMVVSVTRMMWNGARLT